MAIGKRIRFFREQRGMTQKRLGMLVGFSEATASVRIAQYETGMGTPRAELTATLARALDVSPLALTVPGIGSDAELMQTLFALEDSYGLKVVTVGGGICLQLGNSTGSTNNLLSEWQRKTAMLEHGKITKTEYDHWRHNYEGAEEELIAGGDKE